MTNAPSFVQVYMRMKEEGKAQLSPFPSLPWSSSTATALVALLNSTNVHSTPLHTSNEPVMRLSVFLALSIAAVATASPIAL